MYDIIIIRHDQLPDYLLNEIIKVKTVAWPFCYDSQKKWIKINLKDTDLHLLLTKDKEILAYLNLIEIEVIIDSNHFDGYGIGNVCAIQKGKGIGTELIKRVNKFIIEERKVGLLFCKPNLHYFYVKSGWTVVSKEQVALSFEYNNIETLIFNFNLPFQQLIYKGQAF
ncbi:MAG: hypothetical protein PHU68_04655 [Paludibacter sp.]|nr:hypothetical protein [Paludibacter sp.]